ncbi:MAG TPA: M81 family metallopeptidase, partial [Vineibacter sp.]|nr:M81 family metallopeptidase [Vineibacter sp.]
MTATSPRIALLGFAIECNRFAPVSTREDFASDVDMRGNALLVEARRPTPGLMPDMPGFVTEMDRTGPWTPAPLRIASAQPGGPVEHGYFRELMAEFEAGLSGQGPFDGVYVSSHGAALTTESDDPDGELYALIRRIVGPDVPVIGTFDLHANVSPPMVDNISVFVGYRCNPHTDIRERGIEAARHMRELLAGESTATAMVKIPL